MYWWVPTIFCVPWFETLWDWCCDFGSHKNSSLKKVNTIFTTSSWDLPSVTTTAMRFLTWLARWEEGKTWSTANLMALPVCKTNNFNFIDNICACGVAVHAPVASKLLHSWTQLSVVCLSSLGLLHFMSLWVFLFLNGILQVVKDLYDI